MFDHVEFQVRSFTNSLKFYSACLPKLGIASQFIDEKSKCFAFGHGNKAEFLLTEGTPTTPRLHLAFKATSEKQVQEFHAAAVANGGSTNGAPGYRDDYGKGYYAAFVIDPDGHNVEAVFRNT